MRKIVVLFFIAMASQISAQKKFSYHKKKTVRNVIKASNYRGEIRLLKKNRFGTVNALLTSLNYFGDLAPRPNRISTDISLTKPGLIISYNYKYGTRFSVETKFLYGTIKGSDQESAKDIYRQSRNLSFKNHIKDLSITFSLDLFSTHGYYIHRPQWTPYIFVGMGLTLHNPLGQVPAIDMEGRPMAQAGHWIKLQPLGTEGQYAPLQPSDANFGIKPYKLIQPNIPLGYGVKLRIGHEIDLRAEFCFRYFFTDYLDDVSRNYVDLGVFQNDLAKTMSYKTYQLNTLRNPATYIGRDGNVYTVEAGYGSEHPSNMRGNRRERDAIFTFSMGAGYIIGSEMHRAKSR